MSDVSQQLEGALAATSQPANPLRNHQVESYRSEAARLAATAQAPAYVTGIDRGAAAKAQRNVEKVLQEQAAKPLRGADKDKVAALAQEVLESRIRPALIPREDMRRNPAGAVGRFLRSENSPEVQRDIQNWKRAQLALEPESNDPDLANVERFRPEKIHDTGGVATFAADAQIRGNFAMTPKAKENWPLGEPQVETPLKQAQKREATPAQLAALAAARAKRHTAKEQAG